MAPAPHDLVDLDENPAAGDPQLIEIDLSKQAGRFNSLAL
jgi:hypothetical protein